LQDRERRDVPKPTIRCAAANSPFSQLDEVVIGPAIARPRGDEKAGGPVEPPAAKDHFYYWPGPLLAASASAILFDISALTASRLKLAPRCIGG
jgi:hypothetical protein